MTTQTENIGSEADLRVEFKTDIIDPNNNDYWILIENFTIDYDFKFPLISSLFNDYESTLPFNNISDIEYGLKFKNCIFKKNVQLYSIESKNRDIYFDNCLFEDVFYFRSYENIITFWNCTFKNVVKAQNAILNDKVRFRECDFENEVNFINTKFVGLADFWRSKFYQKMIFYKTDFMDTVVFSAVTFKENVLFTYTLINKLILLRGTKVEKGFDISLAIIYGKIGLFEFNLNDYKDSQFINDEEEYENAVSESAIIPIKNKRETFRILKDTSESQKNLSESLKFKAIEKEVLRIELINYTNLTSSDKWLTKFKKVLNNRLERINLGLNKISNDHGDSYGRAVLFILAFGWCFFYFSLLATEKFYFTIDTTKWQFSDGFKLFVEFLNPIHKFDYIENTQLSSAWFYVFDFLGKTFVGYGIYQFIQAFRKYK